MHLAGGRRAHAYVPFYIHTHTAPSCACACGGAHLVPVRERRVRCCGEEDLALRAWEAAVEPERDAVQLPDGGHAVRDLHRVLLDVDEAHRVEVEVLAAAVGEQRVRRHVADHRLREVEVMRVLLHGGEVDAVEVARRPEVAW